MPIRVHPIISVSRIGATYSAHKNSCSNGLVGHGNGLGHGPANKRLHGSVGPGPMPLGPTNVYMAPLDLAPSRYHVAEEGFRGTFLSGAEPTPPQLNSR